MNYHQNLHFFSQKNYIVATINCYYNDTTMENGPLWGFPVWHQKDLFNQYDKIVIGQACCLMNIRSQLMRRAWKIY